MHWPRRRSSCSSTRRRTCSASPSCSCPRPTSAGAHLRGAAPSLWGSRSRVATVVIAHVDRSTRPTSSSRSSASVSCRGWRPHDLATRRCSRASSAERAEQAEHAREEDERRAIAAERNRIARELHDVLAHNLSVMVVQAGAARRIAERSPSRRREAAELIQRTGREALDELRALFGPVRRGEGEALSGPPSLARVDELARRARAAGLPVELRVLGRPGAAAHRHRPHRLPRGAGGAHQRHQARRRALARP